MSHTNFEHEQDATYAFTEPSVSLPVFYDSPHSGAIYPKDFRYSCDLSLLRLCEDAHVDQLIAQATSQGVGVLQSLIARTYLDLNRPAVKMRKSERNVQRGQGLIWTQSKTPEGDTFSIYEDSDVPDVDEVKARIQSHWHPYHKALSYALASRHDQFGHVYHVNWHSCPRFPYGVQKTEKTRRADFILGDRNGASSDADFVRFVYNHLVHRGYSVSVNKPFPGKTLVTKYSEPDDGRHSLQIEIARDLYMDELTLEQHAGFDKIRSDIAELTEQIKLFVRVQCARKVRPDTSMAGMRL